jgi:hypothetical protein
MTQDTPVLLSVVGGGEPTAEELAAIVVALTSRANGEQPAPVRSRWADRGAAVRRPLPRGPGAWQANARSAGVHSA